MDRLVNTLAQQPAAQTLAQTTAQQVATAILANPAAQSSSSSSAVQVPAQNPVVQRPAQQPTTTALTPSSSVTGKQRLGQSSSSSSSSAAASSATSSSSASELEPTNYAATSQSEVSMAAPVGTQGQYLTIFPADFPVQRLKAPEKVGGRGYVFIRSPLGDNMLLCAVVLAVIGVFMFILLFLTGRGKKTDSFLPPEAHWKDGDEKERGKLQKVLPPRPLRLTPGGSPRGMGGSPGGMGGAGGGMSGGTGGYRGGQMEMGGMRGRQMGTPPPPPPPKGYAPPTGAGYAPTNRGYAQPVVRGQGMQMRNLPSQNHGW